MTIKCSSSLKTNHANIALSQLTLIVLPYNIAGDVVLYNNGHKAYFRNYFLFFSIKNS